MKRPIVHLQPGGALESLLHQAATAGLLQPIVVNRAAAKKRGKRR